MTDGRSRRILDVTAYTTLDFVEARVEGHDWTEDAVCVVDVDAREDEETGQAPGVTLALEVDATDADRITQHATRLDLSPDAARTLANDLSDHAAEVERES